MATTYGKKVVAVLDTTSSFGVTIKQMRDDLITLSDQMSLLLADAPETLDSLNEIAAALADDPAFFSTMSSANATLQSNIDALTANAQSARDAIQSALDTRLNVLEADPTTSADVAAVQADVDQNEADSDAADAALSGRLDTLEADPTTASAVAAVQADVDANEAERKTYFDWDSNLSKVINPVRGSRIDVGNNITFYPAAGYNTEIKGNLTTDNNTKVFFTLTDAADDTAAASAGVDVGQLYRNGSVVMIRVS